MPARLYGSQHGGPVIWDAARHGDGVKCTHDLSPIDASDTRGVRVNERNSVRFGAMCCQVARARVVTGSATVHVNGQPAPRFCDKSSDGGLIVQGSGNVRIGGPTSGGCLGGIDRKKADCEAAAAGRTSGSTKQSYGNCGLEAWRNVINAQRAKSGLPHLTEDQLLNEAHANRWAIHNPGKHNHGAASAPALVEMLRVHGVEATYETQTCESVAVAVADGKGVSVHVHPYWFGDYVKPNPADPGSWAHAVAVTGVEYDDTGKISAFYVNDTGTGECGKRLTKAEFERALEPRAPMTVTRAPL